VGEDGDSATFGEIVGDENTLTPLESLRDRSQKSDLRDMIDSLEPREAEIIRHRFGLDGYDELTLEEVGQKFKVTRERIRQLQNIALTKMRRAMADHEAQRTKEEIAEENRERGRMEVIREFITARSAATAVASN
jgi:RNA polymerase primary sigma factor